METLPEMHARLSRELSRTSSLLGMDRDALLRRGAEAFANGDYDTCGMVSQALEAMDATASLEGELSDVRARIDTDSRDHEKIEKLRHLLSDPMFLGNWALQKTLRSEALDRYEFRPYEDIITKPDPAQSLFNIKERKEKTIGYPTEIKNIIKFN